MTRRQARRLHCDIRNYLLWISNVHTPLRQASEWGMRGLQGMFPCCKKRFPSDSMQRRLVLEAIVLVQIFQTEYIGYSQIKSVFDPKYVRIENLHGYDRIAQYYYRPGEYDSEVDRSGSGSDDKYINVYFNNHQTYNCPLPYFKWCHCCCCSRCHCCQSWNYCHCC